MERWRCLSCRWEVTTEPGTATLDPNVRQGQCPVLDCPSNKRGRGQKKMPLATFRRVQPSA